MRWRWKQNWECTGPGHIPSRQTRGFLSSSQAVPEVLPEGPGGPAACSASPLPQLGCRGGSPQTWPPCPALRSPLLAPPLAGVQAARHHLPPLPSCLRALILVLVAMLTVPSSPVPPSRAGSCHRLGPEFLNHPQCVLPKLK